MRVGFLLNQLDNRGSGNAVYSYAHYNEEILGNESKIFTLPSPDHNKLAVDKFVHRFGEIRLPNDLSGIDVLYHIKSGEDDFQEYPVDRYAVHAVFRSEPHGDRYATVSEWMGIRDRIPFVPHIIDLPDIHSDYRAVLGIPEDATVFGRHGGYDSFDIPWVWQSIGDVLQNRADDVYFLFLNTQPHADKHPRVMYFPDTADANAKRAFINTCDAMLHARGRGETFGISVGEFARYGKPVFTYHDSPEKAHIYELRGTARTYTDEDDLTSQLMAFGHGETNHPFYTECTPERVMNKFSEVFLS